MIKKTLYIIILVLLISSNLVIRPTYAAVPAYCQQVCTAGPGTGAVPPGGTCSGSNDCSAAAPVCLTGGISGASSCETVQSCLQNCTLDYNNGGVLPTNATSKYLAGLPGDDEQTSVFGIAYTSGITNRLQAGQPMLTSAIASTFTNKPASTALALHEFKKNLGLPIKEAYAQDLGSDSLNPILGLWRVFRNIALAGFVVIFVVIGIMIMLRRKIDPRTVVTIQQALPKIIIALLLVVFSYSICGLLVDLTNVITRTGLWVLQSNGLIAQGNQTPQYPYDPGTGAYTGNEESKGTLSRGQNFEALLSRNVIALFDNLYNVDVLLNNFTTIDLGTTNSGWDALSSVFNLSAWGSGTIVRTVLWVAMFVAMFRSLFMLITAYLMTVFNILFSPFKFLLMAIPGTEASFEGWLRGILKHLLVFPIVFFMLCFAAIFGAMNTQTNNLWKDNRGEQTLSGVHRNYWNVGPLNGGNQDGIFGNVGFWAPPALGNFGNAIGQLLSLGILLTIPRAANIVAEVVTPRGRPGAGEGAAGEALRDAAKRVPILKGYM